MSELDDGVRLAAARAAQAAAEALKVDPRRAGTARLASALGEGVVVPKVVTPGSRVADGSTEEADGRARTP